MTKHEKNDRPAVRQDRNLPTNSADEESLDDLEGAEELLKTSFTAGNEMKIAVAVIGVLVLVFAAVVVQWLRRSSQPAPTPTEEAVAANDRPSAASRDKDKDEADRREASPFGPSAKAAKSTVVPAVPGSGSEVKPKFGVKGPDTWNFASDAKPKGNAPDDRSPPSSFQPRIASRDASVPASRSKDVDEPKPSLGGWQQDTDVRPRPSSSPPTDPFRNRPAIQTPGADSPPSSIGSPLSSSALTPGAAKPPQPTDGGRWGQGVSNSAERPSAGRAEAPKWGMPPEGFASPAASPQPPSAGAAPSPNPLRAAAPSGPAASLPSTGAPTRPSAPPPSPLTSPTARSNPGDGLASGSAGSRNHGRRTYVVQNGDTLYDIARQQLGKASRWREIYDLNKDLINARWLDLEPGTQLLLPDAGPESLTERPGVG